MSGKEGQKTMELYLQNETKAHSVVKCQTRAPPFFYSCGAAPQCRPQRLHSWGF